MANTKVEEEIRKQFPDHELDVINIKPWVMKIPRILLINSIITMWLYGSGIVSGNKTFREAFWHTPYIFHEVKKLIAKRLSNSSFSFTFQMQSLFDCSLPHVPHFVYTDHTHLANLNYVDFNPKGLFSQNWIELEKQIYSNAMTTFVRSSNIRQSLVEQYEYPAERAVCVYAGSNVNGQVPREKSYAEKNILFVGLDWKRKGGPELMTAFRIILEHHPTATLTIVGAHPKVAIPNCTVLGKLPPQEVARYYEESTIFCMPTHVEPFGIVFLEAMQARLPIVGTRVGAVADFVQDGWNGFLVDPGDVEGIAEALMKLLNDPDQRRQFGERGFALAKERYSWDIVGKRLYQHILEKLA
ncbi:MAG: glycosyltransferase family 4 protein [Anaerolineales bacterium]